MTEQLGRNFAVHCFRLLSLILDHSFRLASGRFPLSMIHLVMMVCVERLDSTLPTEEFAGFDDSNGVVSLF